MNRTFQGPRIKKQLSETFTSNINAYALAAGAAGVTMLAMGRPAQAEIVFTPADKVIKTNFYSVLDLNHDGIPDFKFNQFSVNYRYFRGDLDMFARGENKAIQSANGYVAVLAKGAPIGEEQVFANGTFKFAGNTGFQGSTSTSLKRRNGGYSRYFGPWWNVKGGYIGVAFTIGHEIHYGWIRLSLSATYHSFQTTLTGYAYETVANQEIHAGQLTEEADAPLQSAPMAQPSLGALALGAPALELWRREDSSLPTQ